jgi:hypothetical protein
MAEGLLADLLLGQQLGLLNKHKLCIGGWCELACLHDSVVTDPVVVALSWPSTC